jgi:N-acetylmuramoyl-L-alanine amidase
MLAVAVSMGAKSFTLVIDAGHGGHDAGAIGAFSKEKNINLNVALAFGRYVEQNCPDVKVIYTRKTDVFVTLNGRAEIANKAKADLFISIHTNSLPSGRISRGMETYTLGMHRAAENLEVAKRENQVILQEKGYRETYQGFNPNSAESYIIFEFMQDNNMQKSVELAKYVQSNACSMAGRINKGVKQAGFLVLRATSMPSCLIELGFISTPDEERFLNSPDGIDKLARGIYNAFAQYKNNNSRSRASIIMEKPQETQIERRVEENRREVVEAPVNENVADNNIPTPQPVQPSPMVYKVQVLVAERVLKQNDPRLKGRTDLDYYKEGGMVKYTIGSFESMREAYKFCNELNKTFPGCFVVKFKDGQRVK